MAPHYIFVRFSMQNIHNEKYKTSLLKLTPSEIIKENYIGGMQTLNILVKYYKKPMVNEQDEM